MAGPAITVEVAFSTQPFSTSPSWTDITQYVAAEQGPIVIQRGRSDELSEIQPSTLTLWLKNDDGRFTPGRAASPYYPNVKDGKRIRVTIVYNSVTYRRFDGHVNEWPQSWTVTGGTPYSPVQVTATDRFKLLGLLGELRSILEEELLLDVPQAYYPLAEPDGSLTAASITKAPQSVLTITTKGSGDGATEEEAIQFGAGTGPGTDELSAVMFNPLDDANGKYLEAPSLIQPVGGNGFTLEVWFRGGNQADSMIAATSTFSIEDPNDLNNRVMLRIDSAGNLEAKRWEGGAVLFLLTSSTIVDNNRTHQAVITDPAGAGTARLYLDGVEVATDTTAGLATTQYSRIIVGGSRGTELYRGSISHVAVYNSVLSATRILTHYNAGINGLAGDRTDQRIARIADYIGIPSADRALDVGDTTVGWQGTSGQEAVEAMRTVERTESGVLFMAGDTKLTFHKRSRRYNAAIGLTLDAQQADQVGRGLTFPGDDFGRSNDATITRERNSPVRAINQSSIDEFGLRRISTDGIHQFDSQAQANVEWIVNNYGDIIVRVPTVKCDLFTLSERNSSLVTTILASEISTKVRLSNLPTQAPFTPFDGFIEGSEETIGFAEWSITFNCSPAIFSTVWQLDTAGFSELGVTTKLAY